MKASEARKLAESHHVASHEKVKSILNNIEQYAQKGHFGFTWSGTLTHTETLYFMNLGYSVSNHPDPDPGHPCSVPQVTFEW